MMHKTTRIACVAMLATIACIAKAETRETLPIYDEASLKTACEQILQQAKVDVTRLESVPLK